MQLGPMRVRPYSRGRPRDLPLQLGPFVAGLGEAGSQDHGRPGAAPAASSSTPFT